MISFPSQRHPEKSVRRPSRRLAPEANAATLDKVLHRRGECRFTNVGIMKVNTFPDRDFTDNSQFAILETFDAAQLNLRERQGVQRICKARHTQRLE